MSFQVKYAAFLESKRVIANPAGFVPRSVNSKLFEFQQDIVRWAIRRGRAALFEDCGLGKGPQQLEWARQVSDETGKPVIGFAPLAVAQQFEREAAKFGYTVTICKTGADIRNGINITNYERLPHFDDNDRMFGGIFLDESSILKGFDGKFRKRITDFASVIPYRIAATATPAPNDYMELGNHAEFLGIMSLSEMLATFFTHDGGDTSKWRLKGHAKSKFWEWLASWAIAIRKPSDLAYDDGAFALPPLNMHQHTVECSASDGFLFPMEGQTLLERGRARKDSIDDRVKKCADLVNASSDDQWLVWCNLNAEADALKRSIGGSIQVSGSDSPEFKEQALIDWIDGRTRVLVSKPSIFGFGVNAQQCSHMAFVGLSDSYEELYQAIRRCWRFGQTKPVECHVICAETEGAVLRNIQRKEQQAAEMFDSLVQHMKDLSTCEVHGARRNRVDYIPESKMRIPSWIGVIA